VLYLRELEERRATILASIEEQGKLTDELRGAVDGAATKQALEDIYLPYKPKRKTRATTAIEKGLEPLAKLLFEQGEGDVSEAAAKFLNDQVKDNKEALQGARDIIAEWVAEMSRLVIKCGSISLNRQL